MQSIEMFRRFIFFIGYPFARLWLRRRLRHNLDAFHEQFGYATKNRPTGKIIWIDCRDAVVVRDLVQHSGEYKILLTGTDAVAGAICQHLPRDFSISVRRFVKFWEPEAFIMADSVRLRPEILRRLNKLSIPVFAINGELSDKT